MLKCDLYYLNLGGLPISYENLMTIKRKFINLKSLSLAKNNLDVDSITQFLRPPEERRRPSSSAMLRSNSTVSLFSYPSTISFSQYHEQLNQNEANNTRMDAQEEAEEENIGYYQQLEYLDLSNNRHITRWVVDNPKFLNCCPSLIAFEFSPKLINDIDTNAGGKVVYTDPVTKEKVVWKTYDSLGRRGWLFKTDRVRNFDNEPEMGLVHYDVNTGQKIFKILKLPYFLKLVNKKISSGKGVLSERDEVFGDFERGIYKYYGLKLA